MLKRILFYTAMLVVLVYSGCRSKPEEVKKKDYSRALLAGENALRKITNPAEIPDFGGACLDLARLEDSVSRSISYLNKPSSEGFFPISGISHAKAVASAEAFVGLLGQGLSGMQLQSEILSQFDVYTSIGCDGEGTVLFTGYYTPIFDGSLERTEKFRYPLYSQPDELVKSSDGKILGRQIGDKVLPYPPRAVIERAGMLRGKEIVWLGDEFEVYITHVQGSAKVRLADGELMTFGYAANNGHEYRGISKQMIADGSITRDQLNLSSMIEYFKRNPQDVGRYTMMNPRFVFFRHEPGGTPRGSLNECVTPMRTIATDKEIFPRGSVTFIETNLPQQGGYGSMPYSGFTVDQDTGGAIRAPGRCDIYIGEGDEAGKLAGATYQEGRLYYLFLKDN